MHLQSHGEFRRCRLRSPRRYREAIPLQRLVSVAYVHSARMLSKMPLTGSGFTRPALTVLQLPHHPRCLPNNLWSWYVGACRYAMTTADMAAGTALLEFQIPQQVARYASFMFSFLGRGIFYIFIGSVVVGDGWYRIIPGTIVGFIGVAYAALEFVPSIEPPANMRYAENC